MMTHHFVMTSSLLIKNFKNCKFGDSCDIDYNSITEAFRDVIALIMNQCDPRRPNGASGGHKVSASRAAQESDALVFYKRASLAYAAQLADTLCPPEAPFGRLGSHWLIIRR